MVRTLLLLSVSTHGILQMASLSMIKAMASKVKGNFGICAPFFSLIRPSVCCREQRCDGGHPPPPSLLHSHALYWLWIHPCQGDTSVPLSTSLQTPSRANKSTSWTLCFFLSGLRLLRCCLPSLSLRGAAPWVKNSSLLQRSPWSVLLEVCHLTRAPFPECLFCPITGSPIPLCSEFHLLLPFERE